MLLTRKATSSAVPQPRLARGLPLAKTLDRRGFLKRSGLTVGAGAVCENGTYAVVGASILIPPPGYSPSPAVIWDESDTFAVTC